MLKELMLKDTHKTYEELTGAGGDPAFVEALLRTLQEGDEDLVTKDDLQQEIELLRRDMNTQHEEFKAEVKSIIWRAVTAGVATVLAALGIATALIIAYA